MLNKIKTKSSKYLGWNEYNLFQFIIGLANILNNGTNKRKDALGNF